MRLIDADARIDDLMERCCKDCDKRKGMKNGKRQFIYEIGDAPCRACEVDDIKAELEDAPTIDAVPVVRCRDCEFWGTHFRTVGGKYGDCLNLERGTRADFYCGWGSRSDERTD